MNAQALSSVSAPPARKRVLYVTDLAYEARGRRYCDEDIYLSTRLREHFDIALCHPLDASHLMDLFDAVLVRNSGPAIHYRQEHDAFRALAEARKVLVLSELSGKADMAGKQYLVDLFADGYPVIPTVDRPADVARLPESVEYVVKPKFGADSVGLRFVRDAELADLDDDDSLVQPRIMFEYEVSFYFIGHTFEYALYAPDPSRRWALERYEPTHADLVFARTFIDWNDIDRGIQRVDACRTGAGDLLLVELEDLNPYLSLDRVAAETREVFVADLAASITLLIGSRSRRK
ncbi:MULTISPECIES: hypothetical protein [unclassified Rhodococcus (in: high G+C Gram-positive bacteria)]|uniref:hypothetical protein n=1 Tax=unclassified Rhodococcus (in: high G+C Gram-positive bacteria) TaxID=192944 RepID=UPI000A48A9AD|nr:MULTISPECIES: hypothetical protein [unclassified Rhodococcus (in: high G+C Gram-positive bacteria)]